MLYFSVLGMLKNILVGQLTTERQQSLLIILQYLLSLTNWSESSVYLVCDGERISEGGG